MLFGAERLDGGIAIGDNSDEPARLICSCVFTPECQPLVRRFGLAAFKEGVITGGYFGPGRTVLNGPRAATFGNNHPSSGEQVCSDLVGRHLA